MDTSKRAPEQTPAQWAVRWHGVAVALLMVCSVPVFHLTWHAALGHDKPPIVTRSQQPLPKFELWRLRNGSWMTLVDRHLREASPIVWWLRGSWNEILLQFGVLQNKRVYLGRDDWLFLRATLRPDARRFDRETAARRRFFAELRDVVRAAGAELVVSLVPDKARVYPEFAYADGVIDARKQPVYGGVLQELRDEGIPAVDVVAMLAAARAAAPAQPFYYARDTHWRPEGALAAAQAITAVIEGLPIAPRLGSRRSTELGARSTIRGFGDLVSMLGLLSREVPFPGDGDPDRTRTEALSLRSANLAEPRDYYSVVMRENGKSVPPLVDELDTEILLIGTSFSEAGGAAALALALGRPVRAVIERGASGLAALRAVGDELRAGTRAKVVVWELVERGLFEQNWANAKF